MASRLITLFITLCLLVLVAEVGLRIFTDEGRAQYLVQADTVFSRSYRPNQSIQNRSKVGEYSTVVATNSLGFRDVERRFEKDSGTKRILIISDSFGVGLEVDFESLFHRALQRRLDDAGYQYEVIANATDTYSPLNHYVVFDRVGRRFKPDIVVMTFCFNDVSEDHRHRPLAVMDTLGYPVRLAAAERPLRDAEFRARAARPRGGIKGVLRRLRLVRFVNERVQMFVARGRLAEYTQQVMKAAQTGDIDYDYFAVFDDTLSAEQRDAWDQTFHYIRGIRDMVEGEGARMLLVLVPTGNQINAEEWRDGKQVWRFAEDHFLDSTLLQDRATEYAAAASIPTLDVLPALRSRSRHGRRMYFDFDGHWSDHGHAAVGDTLFAFLSGEGWLEK